MRWFLTAALALAGLAIALRVLRSVAVRTGLARRLVVRMSPGQLADPDPDTRRSAVMSLGRMRERSAVPLLVRALRDPDAGVRAASASALAAIGDPQARDPLAAALGDGDVLARTYAAAALAWLGDRRGLPTLVGELENPENPARELVRQALDRLGWKTGGAPEPARAPPAEPAEPAPEQTEAERAEPAAARPAPAPRVVRVFVSSTFRDMQAERDLLAKRAFPELRRRCRARDVELVEIDLRWGITPEQAERGEVLGICLAEIEQCRPYFVGLLGERYGWIPERLPEPLVEAHPWTAELRARSVTELEIVHGVLADPARAGRAFFFFRDPGYVQRLPPGQRADFAAESPAASARLAELKRRIREAGLPVVDGYPGPEALEQAVVDRLWAAIDADFPAGSEPDALDREAIDHQAFASARARTFVGREQQLAELDRHAAGSGGPLVLVGESGMGKSALLARWTERWRERQPGDLVLSHHVGSTPESADWRALVRRALAELKRRCEIAERIPERPEELRETLLRWLHMASVRSRVVLVLDGLDQLEDRENALALGWLPERFPEAVRVVASCAPGPVHEEAMRRGWREAPLAGLSPEERRTVVTRYLLERYHRRLRDELVERIARAPQCASPLFLQVLLEELRLFGRHEQLPQRIDDSLSAGDVDALFARVLVRLEEDTQLERPGLVRDAFTSLWAAREGLGENEILEALGTPGRPLPRIWWSPLQLATQEWLLDRSGLLSFAHAPLRRAVERRYLPDQAGRRAAHRRLGDHLAAGARDARQVAELPWQWARAEEWDRLAALLRDLSFVNAVLERRPLEPSELWTLVEAHTSARMVDAYRTACQAPEMDTDEAVAAAELFTRAGHLDESAQLLRSLARRLGAAGEHGRAGRALVAVAGALRRQGRWDDALSVLKDATAALRAGADPGAARLALLEQAQLLLERRELRPCLELAAEHERLCRALRDRPALIQSLGVQAVARVHLGELDQASPLLEEQERLCRQAGNATELAQCLRLRAEICRRRGEGPAAIRLLEEGLSVAERVGDPLFLGQCLGALAGVLIPLGALDRAEALLRREAEIYRSSDLRLALAKALGNLGQVLLARGRPGDALEHMREQERLSRAGGDPGELQLSLNNQALVAEATGDLDGALRLLGEKEAISRRLEDPAALASCLNNQATVLLRLGRLDEAWAKLDEKEPLSRQLGDRAGLASCLGNKASILAARGDPESALALHVQAHDLFRELGNPQGMARALIAQARLLAAHPARSGEAGPLLAEAERLAQAHGLGPEAALARKLRAASGA